MSSQPCSARRWFLAVSSAASSPGFKEGKLTSGRVELSRIPSCSTPWSRRFATAGRSLASISGMGTMYSPSYMVLVRRMRAI